MKKLIDTIEGIRGKLEGWRKRSINETTTRKNIIDPILEDLGWDMHDLDEVLYEYSTVDNKAVDYALQLNGKPEIFVEAKAFNDPLEDVKAITQVVGYAANNGVEWCVLTNGIKWKVFCSSKKCLAPEKLIIEISIDPKDSGKSVEAVAKELWVLSKSDVGSGKLDLVGKQLAIDSKVKKELDKIINELPGKFVALVRNEIGDKSYKAQDIRESMFRVMGKTEEAKSAEAHNVGGHKDQALEPNLIGKSKAEKLDYAFWQQFLEKCRCKTNLLARITPGPYNYLGTSIGINGISLNCLLRNHSGAIELYIDTDRDTGKLNKAIFDGLFSEKDEIEAELGFSMEWRRSDNRRSSYIRKYNMMGGTENPEQWPDLQDKMIDALIRFDKAFRHRIKKVMESLKK